MDIFINLILANKLFLLKKNTSGVDERGGFSRYGKLEALSYVDHFFPNTYYEKLRETFIFLISIYSHFR